MTLSEFMPDGSAFEPFCCTDASGIPRKAPSQAFSSAHFSFSWPRSLLCSGSHISCTKSPAPSACRCRLEAIHLVAVENGNSTAIFAVMDIHHDESLLFLFDSPPRVDMHRTGKQKTLFFNFFSSYSGHIMPEAAMKSISTKMRILTV